MRERFASWAATLTLLIVAFGLGLGCASVAVHVPAYVYFTRPDTDDAWSTKIAAWQRRERADNGAQPAAVPPVAGAAATEEARDAPAYGAEQPIDSSPDGPVGTLREKYAHFRAERKRQMARDIAAWIQDQAKDHYVPDGPIDHWATLEETLRRDGDDCDGLELLTFHALRDLGFETNEVYRAVVYRPADGQHHMVTLWFEDRSDPWVIDPTGAMTRGMPRMSDLPSWVPLKIFSDTVDYTVRPDLMLGIGAKMVAND